MGPHPIAKGWSKIRLGLVPKIETNGEPLGKGWPTQEQCRANPRNAEADWKHGSRAPNGWNASECYHRAPERDRKILAPLFEMRAARLIQAEELNRSALITEAELLKNSWDVLIESPDREVARLRDVTGRRLCCKASQWKVKNRPRQRD